MFHSSQCRYNTAPQGDRLILTQTFLFWLLPPILAITGCQQSMAGDKPTAIRMPRPQKKLRLPSICGCIAFSPDGRRLAGVSSLNGTVGVVIDVQTGKELLTLPEREASIFCVAYSPDGKYIAWGMWGSSAPHFRGFSAPDNPKDLLLLTDSATGKTVCKFPIQLDGVRRVAFSPDGKLLASNDAQTIHLWDVATGKEVRKLQGHKANVGDLAFNHDGKLLATVGGDVTVRLWDVASGRLLTAWPVPDSLPLSDVAFRPDGKMLASGGVSGKARLRNERLGISPATIHLWYLNDPPSAVSLCGHKEKLTGLAFHPDGRYLFSLDEDGILFVWDITTRKRIYTLDNGHLGYALAVSPDGGRLVVTFISDHPAIIWDLRPHDKELKR